MRFSMNSEIMKQTMNKLADETYIVDRAIFEAEQEFAENGELIGAKEAFDELEKKYFG